MMNRLRRYTKEERMAMDHFDKEKSCRLKKAADKAVKAKAAKPAKGA